MDYQQESTGFPSMPAAKGAFYAGLALILMSFLVSGAVASSFLSSGPGDFFGSGSGGPPAMFGESRLMSSNRAQSVVGGSILSTLCFWGGLFLAIYGLLGRERIETFFTPSNQRQPANNQRGPQASSTGSPIASDDHIPFDDRLRRLHKLHEEGILSIQEYEDQKREILKSSS